MTKRALMLIGKKAKLQNTKSLKPHRLGLFIEMALKQVKCSYLLNYLPLM